MANPRAFVSFDFDHNENSRMLFVGQAKEDSPTPFVVQDWSSKTDLPQDEWEELISTKINGCHLMIVLVGRSMGSATGVAKEIQFAKDSFREHSIREGSIREDFISRNIRFAKLKFTSRKIDSRKIDSRILKSGL